MNISLISFSGSITETHYLSQLTNALLNTGQNHHICLAVPSYTETDNISDNINLEKFDFPSNLPKSMLKAITPSPYQCLSKWIESSKPDVIHVAFEFRSPFWIVAGFHRKHPIVVTIHEPKSPAVTLVRKLGLNLMQNTNTKFLTKFCDKIIVHGKKHQEYLSTTGIPESKIDVIPHGSSEFSMLNSTEKIESPKNNVLLFGKIASYKGIEYLIEAIKLLYNEIPDITVTIAGAGDFTKYAKLIKDDNHFDVHNRFIPDEEVVEFFEKASVVVLPYVNGSQSSIISIAGNFRKPIIATDVGHFPEMIEHRKTGLIIPPKDTNALAMAITELLNNNELRQEMGDNAYTTIKRDFSWDNNAEKTLQVYQKAIAVRKQPETPMIVA